MKFDLHSNDQIHVVGWDFGNSLMNTAAEAERLENGTQALGGALTYSKEEASQQL